MPKSPVKGTKQVLLELPVELVEEAKGFAQSRSESLKEVVIDALRRHMAYPPPPKPAPLPPPAPPPPAPFPDAAASAPTRANVKPKKPAPKRGKK
ncbi:hypothetical protein [Gemmata sp.]|uniref:hypothetical protein n=1 Tax=Gemmata sp. TaxID=1914242 RepID=UPI003F6F729A